jgi:hypothetical protein
MGLINRLKSKKALMGLGGVGAALLVIVVLVLMNSGGSEATTQRERSAPRTARKAAPKPAAKNEPATTPLFETLKAWKDPFRGEDPQVLELQDRINAVRKEIEYLKVTLEEKRLKQEIKNLEKELGGAAAPSVSAGGTVSKSTGAGGRATTSYTRRVTVKAIMTTEEDKKALITSGSRESWVREGERFDLWEVREINIDNVVLARGDRTYVFFYDRSSFSQVGGS